MKKLLVSILVALLTIPSLCYYVAKYYIDKQLLFKENGILFFTIFCSIMIFGLLLGVYNAYNNTKLREENSKLYEEILSLKETIQKNHYEDLEFQNNNREILLDLEMEKKDELV